jgi:hypothetical protein
MNVIKLKLESSLLGGNILQLSDWSSVAEIKRNEEKIINKPKYIYCKLDSTNLSEIHQLEQLGYQFSEFRINSLFDTYDTSLSINTLYPYIADIITEKSHLNNAIEILLASKDDDRFSKDPMIGLSFSKDRIVSNLKSHL